MDNRLSALVAELQWNNTEQILPTRLRNDYLAKLRLIFSAWSDSCPGGVIENLSARITEEQWLEALTSPRVSWVLLDTKKSTLVEQVVLEELLALVDGGEAFARTDSGILIDYSSSYSEPTCSPCGSVFPYSLPEGLDLTRALSTAVGRAAEVSAPAAEFIKALTFRVVFRQTGSSSSGFRSGSYRSHAGTTFLTNAHRYKHDIGKIADALVHEAIHAAIYMIEDTSGRICGDAASAQLKSPWTGNLLHLEQYVQACFVWWGLFNFWNSQCGDAAFDASEMKYFRDRAVAGLRAKPVQALDDAGVLAELPEMTAFALEEIEKASYAA